MDAYGHAYLTDFGLATRFDDTEKWEDALGTTPFVSPEQLLRKGLVGGEQLRARSDQFSFGVLLYQILTCSLPFDAPPAGRYPSGWEFCTAWRLMSHESFVSCHGRNPNIPQRLNDVLARMMSIDPNDRYSSNLAAVEDLRETLAGRGSSGAQIFVSFSHTDEKFAAELIQQIETSGLRVWWDQKIEKGQDWDDQIEEAMLSSDGMLVLMSPVSIESQESKREWKYWLDHIKRPLIPVVIADCRPPYRLAALQQIVAKGRSFTELASEIVQGVRNAMSRSQRIKPAVLPPKTAAYLKIPSSFAFSIHSADLLNQDKLASLKSYIPNPYRLVLAPALEQLRRRTDAP
jgi:serine/threonine protein kinase